MSALSTPVARLYSQLDAHHRRLASGDRYLDERAFTTSASGERMNLGLIAHTNAVLASADHGRLTIVLHRWLAGTLFGMGLHNLPLAAPALLNIGYHLHGRRVVGRAIVAAAVVVNGGLFVGSLIFMASGQTFEQFRGIE